MLKKRLGQKHIRPSIFVAIMTIVVAAMTVGCAEQAGNKVNSTTIAQAEQLSRTTMAEANQEAQNLQATEAATLPMFKTPPPEVRQAVYSQTVSMSRPALATMEALEGTDTFSMPTPVAAGMLQTVLDDPEDLFGTLVTVQGEIDTIIDRNIFLISPPNGSDTPLMVLTPKGNIILEEGDTIRVTGTMTPFSIEEAEAIIGANLVDAVFKAFEGDPLIIADTLSDPPNQ